MTRLNSKLRLKLPKCYLIPYRAVHVEKYWNWMLDEELQRLTGSEPMTLEEEKENQKSWRDDPTKCTFLIKTLEGDLIGDVNCFFKDQVVGELNVMIAEKKFRRARYGLEAIAGMVWYCQNHLKLKSFVAKIGVDNLPSLTMFTEKLAFKEESRSDVFKEITLVSTSETENCVNKILGDTNDIVENYEDPEIESLKALGNAAFSNRDFPRSIRFYDEAIVLDSHDEILRGNRSAARLRAGELFGALSDAKVCVSLSKDYIKGLHRLGNAWAALGYVDNAKKVYEEALEKFPDHRKAFDTILTKRAEEAMSLAQTSTIFLSTFKLAPKALDIELEIELGKLDPRSYRFGVIIYIWDMLNGMQRLGVYEECVRTGYVGSDPVNPSVELLDKVKTPPVPEACPKGDIAPSVIQYIESLRGEGPLGLVSGLILLFEGLTLVDRELIAKILLNVIQSCEN